jgi:hypothetical protein
MVPLRALFFIPLLVLLLAGPAYPSPVDLRDPRPRWVTVEFEVSPPEKPAQLDTVYTDRLPAWLEPGDTAGQVKVSIESRVVEQQLLADENPKEGSFGDFVWVFDAETGHVISAMLSGTLIREIGWGIFRSSVATSIRVEMATHKRGGFEGPKRMLGHLVFAYCEGAGRPGCTLVEAVPYDSEDGYVNAVGDLAADFHGVTLRTFSPLGEAIFREITAKPTSARSSTSPPAGFR